MLRRVCQVSRVFVGRNGTQIRLYASDNGEQTWENFRSAFASESMKSRRYMYFAQKADVDGHTEAAGLFRAVAESATSHALGHLEFLEEIGQDPVTGEPMGDTATNLKSAISGQENEYQVGSFL
jgi:rubrerythrin